jgi:glycosyltransferase involved in cell wall biosynthesis
MYALARTLLLIALKLEDLYTEVHPMKIAVNARFMLRDKMEGFGHYTHEIMSRMVRDHPEDEFYFYFDRKFSRDYLYSDRVTGKTLFPPARHPFLFYLWYQFTLNSALRKIKPDVFFSPGSFLPLGLQCPSVITVHDVAHRPYPDAISAVHRKYYAYFMPRFLKESSAVITVSEFSKQEILKYYPISDEKITVIYNGIGNDYRPFSHEEQHAVRMQFTQGHRYFLFVGAIHPRKNIARLIEAYTLFRQNTDTNIKLVIAGRKSWDYTTVDQAMAASAYRSDIVFTGYVPAGMLATITGSALALCYISLYEGFGLPVAEAMACGIPVMVSENSAQAEIAGDAGFIVDPMDITQIARGMQQLTGDSSLRDKLSQAGIERSRFFSWDVAAKATYTALKAAAMKSNKNF